MMYALSTTIRISKETKKLLTDVMIKLEAELGKRLDYDDVIRILINRCRTKNPHLLMQLISMEVSREVVEKAHKLLREERISERSIIKGGYGI